MTVENLQENPNQPQEGEQSPATENQQQTGALSLQIKPSSLLPGNRPISSSNLQVVRTYNSVGSSRPVVASGLKFSNSMTVSGNRPIVASGLEFSSALSVFGTRPITLSHLKISGTYNVMGERPVASNEIDDPLTLMGYID
jgi:hypothetical protein